MASPPRRAGVPKAKHQQHTAQIVAHETDLNSRVYALFGLTPDEIKGIEDAAKYHDRKGCLARHDHSESFL